MCLLGGRCSRDEDNCEFGNRTKFGKHTKFSGVSVDSPWVPRVRGLHKRMAKAIKIRGALDMNTWHSDVHYNGPEECNTTHCRAGHSIVMAGEKGLRLEDRLGPYAAGALIYLKSTGMVPNFFCGNKAARADILRCAKE